MTDPVRRRSGAAVLHAAACEVLVERRIRGASVRDIAQRAGVSNAALYYHHAGKEELLEAGLAEASDGSIHSREKALDHACVGPATGSPPLSAQPSLTSSSTGCRALFSHPALAVPRLSA
ncbi:helix-turn-helix domain-containing protein [Actinomadura sp. NPDC048394]|uniref:TetR/AcrR family transcriptional regulator n=1 Tax=Actinomadura sp. NPDC048394 TaxID=3158223 RepID=UPI0033F14E54